MGQKVKGAGPHLTQCGLAVAYLHTKWHPGPSNRLATIHQLTDRQDNGPIAWVDAFYKQSPKN